MQQFEKTLLTDSSKMKELIHKHITEDLYPQESSEIKQSMLIAINNLFETGHTKARNLNKALAFLHMDVEKHQRRATQLEKVMTEAGMTLPEPPPEPERGFAKLGDVAHGPNERV